MMRPATPEETDAVLAAFNAIEKGLGRKIVAQCGLAIYEAAPPANPGDRDAAEDDVGDADDDAGGENVVALVAPEHAELPPGLVAEAIGGGLPIGTLDDDGFGLDLQGAVLVADATQARTVRVTERAARLWLYGRNILGDSVLWYANRLSVGDWCIICNPRGEGIGIGQIVGRFKGKREAVQPVHDLGAYLRDQ